MTAYRGQVDKATKFIPTWVKVAVALALGMGTMVGWKRIVVTVGEKIGKEHLTYAQGACAELVAMATIFAADNFGLPVSTTHVLSSGVAGTMAANRQRLADSPRSAISRRRGYSRCRPRRCSRARCSGSSGSDALISGPLKRCARRRPAGRAPFLSATALAAYGAEQRRIRYHTEWC